MTFAIIYLISFALEIYAVSKGHGDTDWRQYFNRTNTLIACGIIGICDRLNQLIKKKDGEPHA